jgi:hypothetical protein
MREQSMITTDKNSFLGEINIRERGVVCQEKKTTEYWEFKPNLGIYDVIIGGDDLEGMQNHLTVSKTLGRQIPDNLSLHPFIGDEHRNILLVLPIFFKALNPNKNDCISQCHSSYRNLYCGFLFSIKA